MNDEALQAELLRTVHSPMCKGPKPLLCQRVNVQGVVIPGWQCQNCGSWKAVKKIYVGDALATLPEYRSGIHEQLFADLDAKLQKEKSESRHRWWAQYNDYLRSDKWRSKRASVLKRDGYLCQACLSRRASQAHHKTYDHVFDEPLFDLVAVCEQCHERITEMDRRRWEK